MSLERRGRGEEGPVGRCVCEGGGGSCPCSHWQNTFLIQSANWKHLLYHGRGGFGKATVFVKLRCAIYFKSDKFGDLDFLLYILILNSIEQRSYDIYSVKCVSTDCAQKIKCLIPGFDLIYM